jgi:hypothetical protein
MRHIQIQHNSLPHKVAGPFVAFACVGGASLPQFPLFSVMYALQSCERLFLLVGATVFAVASLQCCLMILM